MSRNSNYKNDDGDFFQCGSCGMPVPVHGGGTANRNHCPHCLWSRHVDVRTGDRMAVCRGMMEPAGIWVMEDGEWSVIHRCVKCGYLRANRIAGDDNEMVLLSLALKPLLLLPFPPDLPLEILSKKNGMGGSR